VTFRETARAVREALAKPPPEEVPVEEPKKAPAKKGSAKKAPAKKGK
jgi:hypothetical protein